MSVPHHQRPPPTHAAAGTKSQVLIVVEGPNDVEFLRRIARVVHCDNPGLPDLEGMERRGELVFMPLGGGGVAAWADRLAPLQLPEFHIFDRELPPETAIRQAIVDRVNRRRGCRAVLTRKRSMENYLHSDALRRFADVQIEFGDFDPLPEFVARASFQKEHPSVDWDALPRRAHKRLINRVKRWLNSKVVDEMTFALLSERDPDGEVLSWLDAIARLASSAA